MYFSLIFFLILILPAVIMPKYMLAGKLSPWRIVVHCTIITCVGIMLIFMYASSGGQGVYTEAYSVVGMMSEQAAATPALTEGLGLSEASKEERIDFFTQLYTRSLRQIPVTLMFMAAVIAYLEYILISKLLAKRGNVTKMPKLRELTFPRGTAMAMMLMYLLAWIMSASGMESGEMIYLNINVLFDLVFSLQGISVVLMFFYLKRLPGILGIGAAAIMWITAIGRMFLVLLGMMDMIMGVKSRMRGRSAGKS